MDQENDILVNYYKNIQTAGKLRSNAHAHRWSKGVLNTLGVSLDRGTKKALSKSIPEELSKSLYGVFWLLHFRNSSQSSLDFLKRIGRRSGNSDSEFALNPTLAVFGGLKELIDHELADRVGDSLSPEVRNLWQQA